MENKLEAITTELVQKDFEVDLKSHADLKAALAKTIGDLMESDPNRLKSIFYRIDLHESKLGMALVSLRPPELYAELAQQVIERMQQKAETRLKYQNKE